MLPKGSTEIISSKCQCVDSVICALTGTSRLRVEGDNRDRSNGRQGLTFRLVLGNGEQVFHGKTSPLLHIFKPVCN